MVGKFTGQNTPAVGFSIGFEPITAILSETGYEVPGKQTVALVYDEKDIERAIPAADTLRGQYDMVLTVRPKKLGKLLERLDADGWYGYCIYEDGLKEIVRFDRKDTDRLSP
jgi:histidyl-tRNA synthetase